MVSAAFNSKQSAPNPQLVFVKYLIWFEISALFNFKYLHTPLYQAQSTQYILSLWKYMAFWLNPACFSTGHFWRQNGVKYCSILSRGFPIFPDISRDTSPYPSWYTRDKHVTIRKWKHWIECVNSGNVQNIFSYFWTKY